MNFFFLTMSGYKSGAIVESDGEEDDVSVPFSLFFSFFFFFSSFFFVSRGHFRAIMSISTTWTRLRRDWRR